MFISSFLQKVLENFGKFQIEKFSGFEGGRGLSQKDFRLRARPWIQTDLKNHNAAVRLNH